MCALLLLLLSRFSRVRLCATPIDGSPPGSPVPGILQARTLEWVAISFSNAWKWKVKVKSLSLVWLLATPWTAAHRAPQSMGFSRQECWSGVPLSPTLGTLWMVARLEFSRQEYWSGLPFPPARDLPDPEIEPVSPVANAGAFFTTEPPGKPSFMWPFSYIRASVVAQLVKNLLAVWETWVWSLGWEKRLATSVFWPRKLHGLYSPLGCKKSDRTEWLSLSLCLLLSSLP